MLSTELMFARTVLAVALFGVVPADASNGFMLGLDYSRPIGATSPLSMATDASGAIYVLQGQGVSSLPSVTKVAADGTVIWSQSTNGDLLAVDPGGSVYLASFYGLVTKLESDGSRTEWSMDLGGVAIFAIAVDSASRVYVAGNVTALGAPIQTTASAFQKTPPAANYTPAFIARLNITGAGFDYATYLAGSADDTPKAIAVDADGSAIVAGHSDSPDFPSTVGSFGSATAFLTKLSSDGSTLVYSVPAPGLGFVPSLAVDVAGGVALLQDRNLLARYSSQGYLTSSVRLSANQFQSAALALDPAGNAYVAGSVPLGSSMVKNTLAACTPNYLAVFDQTGGILQATWLPDSGTVSALAVSNDSKVFAAGASLTRLSPNASAKTLQLACVTDPANYGRDSTAPGKIVTLWGESIGPAEGVTPGVTLASGFPTQLNGVEVTFDGKPAPILYASASQINVVAPWSLVAGATSTVCLTYNHVSTNCIDAPVAEAAPAIFLAADGYAAAVNQDGTINSASNPATPGSYVSLFGTGFGPVSPTPSDGAIVGLPLAVDVFPASGFTSQIVDDRGDRVFYQVPLQYAGPAPYQVYGVTQVNVQTTTDMATSGLAISITGAKSSYYTALLIHIGSK